MQRCLLHADCRPGPYPLNTNGRLRVDGDMLVVDDIDTGDVLPVLPQDFDLENQLIIANVTDRGYSGAVVVSILMHMGFLMTTCWGLVP